MHQRRAGFTLIEILVSMALTLFILSILAQAFMLGTETFRTLKVVGDLNEGLRTAATMLRSDLAADHFEGKRRLSDSRFWQEGPPQQGYVAIYQSQASLAEGADADGLLSVRGAGGILAFTVKAKGNRPQDYFTALVPAGLFAGIGNHPDSRFQQGNTLNSQWIEVCYFCVPIPVTQGSANGTPLYALYRQQRLVISDVDRLNWTTKLSFPAQFNALKDKISCGPNPSDVNSIYFNSPADLTIPERRTAGKFAAAAVPTNFIPIKDQAGVITGEDLLLQDVLSFDVQVLLASNPTDFTTPPPPYFDSWSRRKDDWKDYSTISPPNNTTIILAIKVTLRVWDNKAKMARQITVIQDM